MGKREDARGRIERDIVEVGRRHLVTAGAAGLSLRAISRELGMVSSAVYRYVASRDELLTLLLIDAYTDLADAVDAAATDADWHDRVRGIARAARNWAVGAPERWALLYGSPVPGYHAPSDQTVGPGTRVIGTLFAAVQSGIRTGVSARSKDVVSQVMSADFDGIRAEFGFAGDDAAVMACLTLWAGVIGAISLEVFGQYGAETFTDNAAVFDGQVCALLASFAPLGPVLENENTF